MMETGEEPRSFEKYEEEWLYCRDLCDLAFEATGLSLVFFPEERCLAFVDPLNRPICLRVCTDFPERDILDFWFWFSEEWLRNPEATA